MSVLAGTEGESQEQVEFLQVKGSAFETVNICTSTKLNKTHSTVFHDGPWFASNGAFSERYHIIEIKHDDMEAEAKILKTLQHLSTHREQSCLIAPPVTSCLYLT